MRRVRGFTSVVLAVAMLSPGVTAQAVNAASDGAAPSVPWRLGSLPIAAEHRYRMAAKVRPFLLFWIGRDNVGEAHVVRRRSDDGAFGFELLIGSDPTRAPRRINRWGYIAEEVHGSDARLLGVMKQSNEQSLDEAKSQLAKEAQKGEYIFKAIQAVVSAGEASSRITTIRVAHDLTFRDAETLLELIEHESAGATTRRVRLSGDTRPGFLTALTELIHHDVAAHNRSAAGQAQGGARSLPYIYNGSLCDLTLRESKLLRTARLGTRSYPDVVRARFRARSRETRKAVEFELLYGTSGPLAEIPVHAMFQPRWWLQVELFLDEADQP